MNLCYKTTSYASSFKENIDYEIKKWCITISNKQAESLNEVKYKVTTSKYNKCTKYAFMSSKINYKFHLV